ncbi:outer membrane lipoprotein-sorting protein [Veronia nyctiphanis]|uniref:Outer membrane lipoprotein-sorting protein n=1 Tax=Veronia nyctiphanis TaxID=1278244 RepID=A0A4Q0YX23_9GAMM|nr:outer membrane lipoprotein-sorting protein [Veronia nyctiphanis]RXJ74844.1 outer membrane lipoprotein-sorting protein [Veronia nyctiphanis]
MKKVFKHLKVGIAVLAMAGLTAPVFADEAKGLDIAKEMKSRAAGWGDSQAKLVMELKTARGDSSTRKLRVKNLEVQSDGDKGMTIFDEPKDVRGTVFLSYSHVDKPDDQWLYLPALKRVKRIASRNKSGPFMGSEFAYEDLSSFELDKYAFTYLRDEAVNGEDAFVIEQIPTDEFSGYTKQIVWVSKEHYRVLKVEFYDRKKALLKTLMASEYKQYLNKFWRAHRLEMQNHQTGKSTVLATDSIEFNTGLREKDFSKSSMSRVR